MYLRHLAARLEAAVQDTRVVLVVGPRQAGKTTLVRALGSENRPYFTLDDATTLSAAQSDPTAFIRGLERAVIDEIQRAPSLLLAIKETVDRNPQPGRFLLTGSANILTIPHVADSLAGRMETLRLLPLSQSEIRGQKSPSFLGRAFAGDRPMSGSEVLGPALVELVLTGGYPEMVARQTWARREDWASNYVDALIQRDVRDLASIDQLDRLPRLLSALAAHSGQLVNNAGVGASIGLNHVTTRSYTAILEQLFVLRTLPPWYNNALKRLTKTPKIHFLDSGLLAVLRGLSPASIARDRQPFGALLESFVVSECLKAADASDERFSFSHFRNKDGNEVDLVIEDRRGNVVGVEVKAAATVDGSDFAGLRKLADAVGERFVQGLVLHDHDVAVPFGPKLWAAPLADLWT